MHYNQLLGKQVKYVTRRALKAFIRYDWPGNVRELLHVVESAMLLTDGDCVDVGSLPAYLVKGSGDTTMLRPGLTGRMGAGATPALSEEAAPLSLDQAVNDAAKDALVRALQRSEGNCIRAARLLGVSRYTVYRMISRFGLAEVRTGRGPR